jgi:hypothetical protein
MFGDLLVQARDVASVFPRHPAERRRHPIQTGQRPWSEKGVSFFVFVGTRGMLQTPAWEAALRRKFCSLMRRADRKKLAQVSS